MIPLQFSIFIIVLVHSIEGSNVTWYQGCYQFHGSSRSTHSFAPMSNSRLAGCGKGCWNQRFQLFAVQTVDGSFHCFCMNNTEGLSDGSCCKESEEDQLPMGSTHDCYGIYTSLGPYLIDVAIETDGPVAIVNKTVAVDIIVERAAALNISADEDKLGQFLHIQWSVGENGSVLNTTYDMQDNVELTHRPKYIFPEIGTYTVDVTVSNGLSTLSTSHDIEVIYPAPHNLQLDILDDNIDLPACIPSEVKLTKVGYQQFAIFVDSTVTIEASVSMGTDLMFSFWLEDVDEERMFDCSECTSVQEVHTFNQTGEWTVIATVGNSYGWTSKNITVVIVEKQLSNLQIQVDPNDSPLATTGDPIKYIISMVTTSRSNLSLQVWYGDGHNNTVSAEDTVFPALVLTGDGREMDIVADYGNGCELIVEFEYKYRHEGLFKPKVAVFEAQKEKVVERRVEPRRNDFYMPWGSMFLPTSSVPTEKPREPLMRAELANKVLVVKELTMVHIEVMNAVSRVVRCDQEVEFAVKSASRHNITVHWVISKISDSVNNGQLQSVLESEYNYDDDDFYYYDYHTKDGTQTELEDIEHTEYDENDLEVIKDHTSASLTLSHHLSQVGVYLIGVEVENAMSSAKSSISIVVQCPIGEIYAACSHEYIETGAELQCSVRVTEGSDVLFIWTIDGQDVKHYIQQENYTSSIKHRFHQPGIYDIVIKARNNINNISYEVQPVIHVQNAIRHFKVYKSPRTLFGNITEFAALYTSSERNLSCSFDFDFGDGRRGVLEECDSLRQICYAEIAYRFASIGKHTVTVYAYNDVSEVSQTVDIWVHPDLDKVTIEAINESVVGSPTRFIVKEHGETMVTDNVYFTWKTAEEEYFTNSPLFQITFTEDGNHTLTVNATNPVVSRVITVNHVVLPRSEVKVQLLHDLYVTVDSEVNFTLQGPLVGWNELRVEYSDGLSENYDGVTFRWSHKFSRVGIQQVFVTLLGVQGTSQDVSSYIMVEEPVEGLEIDGPLVVPYYNDYDTFTWTARLAGGTHVIYRWTLQRTIIITSPEFETNLPGAGLFLLTVEAVNDVTELVVAETIILVQPPVYAVQTQIIGNLVGRETVIQANISAYIPFYIQASFGDGSSETIYSEDFWSEVVSVTTTLHLVNFTHVYEFAGEYEVVVNVSNNISFETSTELFVPVRNITLIPKSPWLIQTLGYAKVIAVVTGGRDLMFGWNFSDDYGDTYVRSYKNQTSVAVHPYDMSGEYLVTFCVTGQHYPHPGLCTALGFNFTVVDPIDVLKEKTDKRYVKEAANRTQQILFGYESSGSHVRYVFDFGDGSEPYEVAGIQLPPQSLEMTMYGEATHVYTEVGVYPVMVTAVNPLGNVSLPRPRLLYVQEPPTGLQFCNSQAGNYYTGRVGQNISLCATVMSGTNVTLDWKLGDQNDMVKAGPRVSHQYQTAKVHKVSVTAKNKVASIQRSIYVDVNHEIQGVSLIAHQTVVAGGEPMWFEAVVRPNYTNIVSKYQWMFKSLARQSWSARTGRHQGFATQRSSQTAYIFDKPGVWTAAVSAQNSISSAISDTVEIEVQAKVSNLEIIVDTNHTLRLVNRTITFEYFAYSGSKLRLTWSFGDGSKIENTTDKRVEHTFASEGRYTITLTASNKVSSQTVSIYLFVLEKSYCNQPDVTLLLQNKTKVPFSKSLTIEADVKSDCNLTSVMVYEWSLEETRNQQQRWRRNRLNRRVLVLPPAALDLGLHKINFKVKMPGTIVYAEAAMFVEVVHSPLVSKIRGGVYRQAKLSDVLVMDGSLSYDPDDVGTNTTLSYSWTCRYTKDNGNYGDECYIAEEADNVSCAVPSNTSVLVIPGECLVEAANFTFELTVSSEDRENTSFQVVHMIEENRDTLDISIVQPYSKPGLVNADRKLAFFTECSNCPQSSITYQWSLRHLPDYDVYNLARAHDLKCVEADGQSYSIILQNKEEEDRRKQNETDELESGSESSEAEATRKRREAPENSTTQFLAELGLDSVDLHDQFTMYGPMFGQIVEGGVDSGHVIHRRRRDLETTTGTGFEYPMVKEGTDPNAREKKLPMPNFPYIPNTLEINEGQPGESGSSLGRMYPKVMEGHVGSGRNLFPVPDSPDIPEPGHMTEDRLEGNPRDKQRKYTILDQRPVSAYLQASDTKTGLNSSSLVIRPGVLKQGLTYILRLRAYDEERHLEGHAMSSFTVNESPVKGRCSISPESGIVMETEFNIICKEWRDKHEPLMYEVSYSMTKSLHEKHLVYRGIDHEFSVRLPAGKPEEDNNVYVSIDILDSLLAKTSVCSIAIRVTPRPSEEEPVNRHPGKSLSQLIHDKVTSPVGILQQAVDHGNDAVSKVYISYLADALNSAADRLNSVHPDNATADPDNNTIDADNGTADATNSTTDNVTLIRDDGTQFAEGTGYAVDVGKDAGNQSYEIAADVYNETERAAVDKQLRVETRTKLLRLLEELPVRDEAEILQTAQALSYATAKDDELSLTSVDLSVKILKSLSEGAREVYNNDLTPTGNLIPLAVQSTASIVKATTEIARHAEKTLEIVYKRLVSESVEAVEALILNELKYHVISEEPISSTTDYFSVLAARHSAENTLALQIHDAGFRLPERLPQLLGTNRAANENCFQSHMTSFKKNPYSFKETEKVNSVVSGLTLYDCQGRTIPVADLPQERRVQVELPNTAAQSQSPLLKLERWAMNLHQFNVSVASLNLSLHLVIDLVPVMKGRLFPITVLISWTKPLSPDFYHYKYDFEPGHDHIDLFFPAGTLNVSGTYYIGLVDSGYNAGRPRPGEITTRYYTLRLWWGECLYWNTSTQAWGSDGCQLSQRSTYDVTRCQCNHLTVFGVRFERIPNELDLLDVDNFFSLRNNPVTLTLVSLVVGLYLLAFLWCRHADTHDSRKGGIVYLLDNTAIDQQKYEVTVETGIGKGAGTTAKISLILHGEEGMSETRELISEDDRPMFERNSIDKFILTLPESIGRIWKVQIWHNNSGESPSWYLSRVNVRDLNTGSQYVFQCDKWLAVEEEDGKVEREFMLQEGPCCFAKVFMTKTVQYMADLHVWLSLATCPPYSGFVRVERLTVCLTIVMLHLGFLAVWYHHTVTEYRGEFSLLDVSWASVMVGAICCALVVPISLLLEILFRRSKPKHASSCHNRDEGSQWDIDYPSGKPMMNEQESEDTSSEHVPPVMTYSLLDQSILNWPNIQTWAQKQWLKRQQSVRSHAENRQTGNNEGSDQGLGNQPKPISTVESVFTVPGLSEMDQASSGFEDCSSLIRPKASVDSTHTTAAPSVAESLRTHKPPSLPDSLGLSSKPGSVSDSSIKTSKAPSISSSGSNKSSVLSEKKAWFLSHVYLPYWCRYVAWSLCIVICIGCAAVTIVYGFKFGTMKSILWLQSLYFSCIICAFVAYPLMVVVAVTYSSLCYVRDPLVVDTYSFDLFNREKAKEDLHKWKKQMELLEDGEALERGVAARQRSRYLRFARPPQEKQLIEARKRVMKEKKAIAIFRESVAFGLTIGLLLVIAYGKDSRPCFHLNSAVKSQFVQSGSPNFTAINSREDWYRWFQASFLKQVELVPRLEETAEVSRGVGSTFMIGTIQLRQQRVAMETCQTKLPYDTMDCLGDTITQEAEDMRDLDGVTFTNGYYGNFMIGKDGVYDGSGYVLTLNQSRSEASRQISALYARGWLDRQTRAVFVEFTLYNAPYGLFTAVDLLMETSPTGGTVTTVARVTSTHLFRYVTAWDNLVLICEMLYFLVMIYICQTQCGRLLRQKKAYFLVPWNVMNFVICILSVLYCTCYIYRFFIVSSTVESLRSTYYEKYVDMSFVTFWDEMLRCTVSVLLFLSFLKCLRLLRYNKQFAVFGDVYRRARREIIALFAMYCCVTAAYASISGVTAVGHLLVGRGSYMRPSGHGGTSSVASIFIFSFCIFGIGFLMAYMIAILTHYLRSRRKRRLLAMGAREAVLFYWRQFQLWTGLLRQEQAEEEIIVLPPEFTMAEIEYQVDELLFRMNALTGSHGLPEKPPCYLTDSDCTYGGGDDGISSGGSEGQLFGEDRLEQRVQKIEDNLCSQEPFLAQLLKLDGSGGPSTDDWSQEKEKQLRSHLELEIFRQLQIQRLTDVNHFRSHLELEIFRQLQIQRQDLKSPSTEDPATAQTEEAQKTTPGPGGDNFPGYDVTSSDDSGQKQSSGQDDKPTKPPQSHLTTQLLQDLITKSPHDLKELQNDNSSSNPDSPLDKLTFSKVKKNTEGILKPKTKATGSSDSSSEKISPDLSLNHTYLQPETEGIKKPTKPTFLHSRESSLSEASKGSPSLKVHGDKGARSESLLSGIERMLESSSGSEQDGIRVGRKMSGKRNLRKTKSRGKGKGADSLEPALILDELEMEEGEGLVGEVTVSEPVEKGGKSTRDGKEHTVMADVHHVANR